MSLVDFLYSLLSAAFLGAILRASTPMVFAALGGLISDLAGVINVALEGMMLIAAFAGVVGSAWAATLFPGAGPTAFALFGAGLGLMAALALALLLAVLYLEFDANLIIAGVGVNILSSGLTVFLLFAFCGDKGSSSGITSYALPVVPPGPLAQVPILGALVGGPNGEGQHVLIYGAALAVLLIWALLHRTRLGLHLRAVGENPEACRSVGIRVKRVQYQAVLLSGLLAGLGGIYLSMGYLTLFQAGMTAGRGFLALAAIFLGARGVFGTTAAAVFFGLASVFAAQLGLFGVPTSVVLSVAPVVAIAALLTFTWQSRKRQDRILRRALAALPTHKDTP